MLKFYYLDFICIFFNIHNGWLPKLLIQDNGRYEVCGIFTTIFKSTLVGSKGLKYLKDIHYKCVYLKKLVCQGYEISKQD